MRKIFFICAMICTTALFAKEPVEPTSYNYQRGVELVSNGEYDEGEKYLLEELNENPKNGYAYAWLSSVEYSRDEFGATITLLNKALKYLPKKDKHYNAWAYTTLSKVYMDLKDTVQALDYISLAIKTDPSNTDWIKHRGSIYIMLKQYNNALDDFNRIIKMEPGNTAGYLLKGLVYYNQEMYDKALELYKHANLLEEQSFFYSYMATAENKLQRYEDAADHIVEALKLEDFERDAMLLMNLENKELLEELIPRIKVQIAKNPSVVEWKIYLMEIYKGKKQYENAIDVVKEIKILNSSAFFDHITAELYESLGNYDMSLKFATSACEADSLEMDYKITMISIYDELNRLQDALDVAEKIIKQNPDESRAYAVRADMHFEMQNYDKAIEDYSTAIALESSFTYARYKRGYAYLLSNDNVKAKKDFQKIVDGEENGGEKVFALIHLGEKEKARAMADSILLADTIYYIERYNMACAYSLLGETELAFATLEEELKDGYNKFNHIRRDMDLVSLRGERMDSLLHKYELKCQERINAYQGEEEENVGEERVVEIPFTAANGVTKVDCTINNLPLNFIFDTGASDVTISQVEANFMFKNGYLSDKDIIGKQYYRVADGNISVGTTIILNEIQFGGLTLKNVRASVVKSQNAPLLLGQTVLQRLGKIEIDNTKRILKITTKQ